MTADQMHEEGLYACKNGHDEVSGALPTAYSLQMSRKQLIFTALLA